MRRQISGQMPPNGIYEHKRYCAGEIPKRTSAPFRVPVLTLGVLESTNALVWKVTSINSIYVLAKNPKAVVAGVKNTVAMHDKHIGKFYFF